MMLEKKGERLTMLGSGDHFEDTGFYSEMRNFQSIKQRKSTT